MRRSFTLLFVLVFVLLGSAYADFSRVSVIEAPHAPYGASIVTGLSAAGDNLLVAVRADTSSFLFLVRPDDGQVLRQAEFAGDVPCCQASYRQFMSGAAYDVASDLYLAGDACGALLEIVFSEGGSYISDGYHLNDVETPTGLVVDDDTVYIADWDDETLTKSIGTSVLGEYGLPPIDSPAALAAFGNNLLVASYVNGGQVCEITKEAALVETHLIEGLNCSGLHGAAFLDDHLYLAGACDSIFILEGGIWVPEGDSIPVEVVPGELEVDFDSVSTSGYIYVDVSDSQACPAPLGVALFPPFYDMTTTASFDYVAGVELTFSDSFLPPGYEVSKLRIFKRPSGECQDFRDVTIEWVEVMETFKIFMRSRSEDDEFSVFALGLDSRTPREVIELKFAYLGNMIYLNGEVIPPDVYGQMTGLYSDAMSAYYRGNSSAALALANEIADLVRATEAIPHTFDGTPGSNVAGGIISRCHTLAFSLMYSEGEAVETGAAIVPDNIIVGLSGRMVKAYFEVPGEFAPTDIDPLHIFMNGYAQALPESVTVFDYDDDGMPEVRAMFPQADVEDLFTEPGSATVHLTGFVGGFELRADAVVDVFYPQIAIMTEDSVEVGHTYQITWSLIFEDPDITYTLCYSLDAGQTWEEIVSGLTEPYYYWTVPDVEATTGLLRVRTLRSGEHILDSDSDPFSIVQSAGVDAGDVHTDKIMLSPNPSRSEFRIQLALSGDRPIGVYVYSVEGQLVRTLVDGETMSGVCSLVWGGRNDEGTKVAAGVYFVVLREGEQTTIKKMILER
jgi:hypothetical protein